MSDNIEKNNPFKVKNCSKWSINVGQTKTVRPLKFKKHHSEVTSPSRSRRNILPPITADFQEVKTCKTFDPDFFTFVEGRPLKINKSLNLYKSNIRNLALNRVVYGFVMDEILRIERSIKNEKYTFEECSKHFDEYKASFDKFLAHDNNKTIILMQKSDGLVKELASVSEEYKRVSFEYANAKSNLHYLDETFLISLSIERFLHTISPLPWQQAENIDLKKPIPKGVVPLYPDIYKKYNPQLLEAKLSAYPPIKLYFKTPEELAMVFQKLEKQSTEYLIIAEETSIKVEKIYKALDELNKFFKEEIECVKVKIAELEEVINEASANASIVKNLFDKVLHGEMQKVIASEIALQLETYVGYAYEQVISTNETNLSTLQMAKDLDDEYSRLMLQLGEIDVDVVSAVEKEFYANDKQELKNALIANRLLNNFDKINRRLRKSYEEFERSFY